MTQSYTQQAHELLKLFAYEHLPEHLQTVSKPFGDLAIEIVTEGVHSLELVESLKSLKVAKDWAVNAELKRT